MKRLLKIEMIVILGFMLMLVSFHAEDRKGSIDLYFHGNNKNDETLILDNVPFMIYKIACYDGQRYIVDDMYKDLHLSFDDVFSSSQTQMAMKLDNYIQKNHIQGHVYYTNHAGHIYFNDLELGIYFIVQKDNYSYQDGIFISSPFLVKIPMSDHQQTIYHLSIEPKSEWIINQPITDYETSTNSQQNIQTSDDESLIQYTLLAGLSFFVFILEYRVLKKES